MIKIGKYESDATVYVTSDGNSYNFEADYADLKAIRSAFAASGTVEFSMGGGMAIVYNPQLIVMQIVGDKVTTLFAASSMPIDKTEELEAKNAELAEKNEELMAALADANETIDAMGYAIAELGEIVGGING